MRLCYAVFHYNPALASRDARHYLERATIHRALPQAMAARGHRVEVVHLYPYNLDYMEGGVRYHFVASGRAPQMLAHMVGKVRGRNRVPYEVAVRAIRRVCATNPDLIHFHGATLNLNLFLLFWMVGRHKPPVLLHYHGGQPAQQPLARLLQRANFGRAARLLFTTREHAQPYIEQKVLRDTSRVVEVVETSSTLQVQPRTEARRESGLVGNPIFLWVGRLHPVKDPLTALRGFERIWHRWPDARLYMYYLTQELLPVVQEFLASRPALERAVHLRGKESHERMGSLYNSADFLLQASVREFSGCAILEAMACGTIPVVTDIPSFATMTEGGRYGILFPPGDAEALAAKVLAVNHDEIPSRSRAIRAHFERALSFPAMAARMETLYKEVVVERRV